MSRFVQENHFVNAATAVTALDDFANGSPAMDVVNLGKYDRATWVYQQTAGNTGTLNIQVDSCDDVTPSTATAIGFDYWTVSGDTRSDKLTATAVGYTTVAGSDQMVIVEINSSELSGTDKYARVQITEVTNDPVSASCLCIMSKGRVVSEVPPTAIV